MRRLLWITVLASVPLPAQSVVDGTELLRKARSFAEETTSWRGEVVETSRITGPGINLQSEVRTKIAAQRPLKLSRQNSGSDRTIMVCDGSETFYSGDGNSYSKGEARVTPQCDLPLIKFYEWNDSPASISVLGRDHVLLADGDRACVLVRATSRQDTEQVVRTMCIDLARPLLLREVTEIEDEKSSIRSVETRTFTYFESEPIFPSQTFRFTIPLGAREVKPPI